MSCHIKSHFHNKHGEESELKRGCKTKQARRSQDLEEDTQIGSKATTEAAKNYFH